MNALDIRILRHLGLQPFITWPHPPELLKPSRVAALIGVSTDTARERIARMEAEGVISGYQIYPNFGQLGLTATTEHFRVKDVAGKSGRVEAVAMLDGVVGVYDYLGPELCVDIAHRSTSDRARKVELVRRMLDADAAHYPCFAYHIPPVERGLDALDWRIIQALRGRALRPVEDIGTELDVSGRTVRRRFERMVKEGAFDIVPVFNPGRITGFVLFELVVTFDAPVDPAVARPALDAVDDALAAAWSGAEGGRNVLTAFTLAPSVAAMEALRQEVERASRVLRAEVLIPAGSVARATWIDEAIEERIGALSKKTITAPPS
jgi:DNA-binding Lrp family transcriptional regulator